jgi:Domain of unknown function (DUF4832)/Domain of unknown function (DUF4874)
MNSLKNGLLFLSATVLFASCATNKKINYTEDKTDIVNPERGFYIPSGTSASHFVPLNVATLKSYRDEQQQLPKATYKVRSSLIYRGYELDNFLDKPISKEFLQDLQKDFDAVREAGLKMILRFAYTNTSKGGSCNDEYKICPPYGDARSEIVFQHIVQLKPLLQKNADVIAVMQEGFIGIWGENYFTDYFGDASKNGFGKITDSGWTIRNEFLKRLLDALPKERMIQVRTPQIKQKFVYGPSAKTTSAPLEISQAYSETDIARLGFHNDCFLSGPDDYGTYYDYGSSSQQRQPANETLRNYIEEDTRFTAVGGETCDDAYSPQNDCEPAGHAETEMRNMHYSFLNAGYNTNVDNDWDSAGCMSSIKMKLGYRFVLKSLTIPKKVNYSKSFILKLEILNQGYASPFNKRPVYIILRNIKTKTEHVILLKTDIRFLSSGAHTISERVSLDSNIPDGKYRLFLSIPDANASLAKRPEYSIRLANINMWEGGMGYNDLHHILRVK